MGHYDAALALLDRDPMMVNKKVDNKTPLHAAFYGGQVEIIKLLLDKGAEVNNILYWTIHIEETKDYVVMLQHPFSVTTRTVRSWVQVQARLDVLHIGEAA
jgi:hypothetical protein